MTRLKLVTLNRENLWLWGVGLLVLGGLFVVFKPKPLLETRLFENAIALREADKLNEATDEFEKVVTYAPDGEKALEAARIGGQLSYYSVHDYNKAIFFYRHIIRHSLKADEIKEVQSKIAEIFYEKLSDYPQAIVEYNRLLQMNPPINDEQDYREKIAESYYHAANFDQALLEAEDFERKWPESPKNFELLSVKGNALMGQKRYDEALRTYEKIIAKFPNHDQISQVYLSKSSAYEEKKEWDNAIATLEAIRESYPHPEVLEIRIKSILRRKEKKKSL